MNDVGRDRRGASKSLRAFALCTVLALVFAACGSSRRSSNTTGNTGGNGSTGGSTPVVDTSNCPTGQDTVAVNSDCVPDLLIASGAVQWGNTKFPWMLGSELVPYPLEVRVFVDYLKKNKPNAKIAVLKANDDFGQSYAETLQELIKGTNLTVVQTQGYDPESSDVKSAVTSLAATKADAFLLGATLLACRNALTAMGE